MIPHLIDAYKAYTSEKISIFCFSHQMDCSDIDNIKEKINKQYSLETDPASGWLPAVLKINSCKP